MVEQSKLKKSLQAVERSGHRFVPFVVSSLGRMGGHGQTLLDEWAARRSRTESARIGSGAWRRTAPQHRRYLIARWMQMLSVYLHDYMGSEIAFRLSMLLEGPADEFD